MAFQNARRTLQRYTVEPATKTAGRDRHAVVGYSLGLRAEAAEFGVRVTVVYPDAVKSNLVANTPTPNVPTDRVPAWAGTVKHVDTKRAANLILRGVAP